MAQFEGRGELVFLVPGGRPPSIQDSGEQKGASTADATLPLST